MGASKKTEFVHELYSIASKYVAQGICSSVSKKDFKSWIAEAKLHSMSPIGLAFGSVIDSLFRYDKHLLDIEYQGLSLVVESGNRNNPNIDRYFKWLSHSSPFASALRTISFVDKRNSRAIQLADFLAFFGRRTVADWDAAGYPEDLPKKDIMS